MIKESVTIDDAVCILNEALQIDREAISALFSNKHRELINDSVIDHPSIIPGDYVDEYEEHGKANKHFDIGLMGIINGIFGNENGHGGIALVREQNGLISSFRRVTEEDYPKNI